MVKDIKLTSSTIRVEGTVEAPYGVAYEKGWTDGLPIIVPTAERVREMLGSVDRDPQEVVAEIEPTKGAATLEKIAINAVMAGCLPEYLPVVVAAVEAMAEPQFNLNAIQCTQNPAAPLAIVNGPIVRELGINGSYNCLGQGNRANATIGRAIRFVLMNIGGAYPGTVDKASQGQPGKYSFCMAENEEMNPWQPLNVERGFDGSASTVTVVGVMGVVPILTLHGRDGMGPLKMIAHSMNYAGNNNFVVSGGGDILVILGPGTAEYAHKRGFSKDDIRQYLWEHSRQPLDYFSEDVQDHMIERKQVKDGYIYLTNTPQDIILVVAGASGSHSVFAPTFGPTRSVTRPVRLQ